MLHIKTWKWGKKYTADDVHKLASGLKRHMGELYQLECITDNPDGLQVRCGRIPDPHLTAFPGCFARLRMFDLAWQKENGIKSGDRIVCIDLDVVITGPLFPLFYRPEPFLILQGANAANPCPYNGSIWMLRAGYRPDVWTDFSIEAASKLAYYDFPDDQGWLHAKLPNENGWEAGNGSGIYAFQKPGWPKRDDLPADARVVVFPGWRDPARFKHLPWIRQHWCL